MKRLTLFTLSAAAMALIAASPASAQSATGTWLRDNGNSRVRIAPCGEALCGTIAWLKPGVETPSKVGQRVFFDMMPDGAGKWAGKAFNPEDGQTYVGKMSVSGSTLTTAGCRLGGLVCRSVNWSKVN
jgi:uncharacterized protein (DUF2147 family)